MFRSCIAFLLLAAFATQTFERSLLTLDYYVNTGAFAKNCENKFRPQMHCNGQCVLMKKLKEQENKDRQAPERKSENKSEVIASGSFDTALNPFYSDSAPLLFLSHPQTALLEQPRSIFHPPNA